jgi:hypothetical protein
MKKLGTIVLFLGMQLLLSGQPDIQWHKTYGGSKSDRMYSIQPTQEGGYIALSMTASGTGDVVGYHGSFDFWVLKLDKDGNIEWSRAYGGSAYDWPYDIRQAYDGGYIAVGYTESEDGDITNPIGEYDAWILKLNVNGDIEWEKSIGGSKDDQFHSFELTKDGNYVIVGYTRSIDGNVPIPSKGGEDLWILKMNPSGEFLWQNRMGGQAYDAAEYVQPTRDGGYIIIGDSYSNDGDVTGGNGGSDFWVVKTDNHGQIEWQNTLGGMGGDYGNAVKEISDGYIVCGEAGSNNGDVIGFHGYFDAWVLKLNHQGEIVWQRSLGGSNVDYARDILIEQDSSIIIAGSTKSKDGDVKLNIGIVMLWMMKLSPDGQLVWQKTYGGTQGEESHSMCRTADGAYAVGGYSWSEDGDLQGITSQGQSDAWLIKFAPESTSTTQAPTPHLELFPNPATHTVFLNTPQYEESLQAIVTDLSGRELYRQQVNSFDGLEVSSLNKGVYLVEAIGEGGVRYVGKLLKQ